MLLSHAFHMPSQEEFDRDRELRLLREAELMKQLTDHEYVVSDHFEKQIVSTHRPPSDVLTPLQYMFPAEWIFTYYYVV